MKAWLKVVGLGCAVGSISVACTIRIGDRDKDESEVANTGNAGTTQSGGRDNEGGDPSGGRSTGGTSNGGTSPGGAANGGAANGGGGAGGAANGGAANGGATNGGATNGGSGPGGGAATGGRGGYTGESCVECLQIVCADEFAACRATDDAVSVDFDGVPFVDPNGLPDCIDEYVAFQRCFEAAWVNDCEDYLQADCGAGAALVDYGGDVLPETNELANCTQDVDDTGNDCIDACINFANTSTGDACG
ncbi:MAG: hypothetical protein JW751_17360 [Polyangiaceae bacterium]|nr:hypothetical protein [Polyangiaceae bacterium]